MHEEINELCDRVDQLTNEHGLDPVMVSLMRRLRRVLEKRGFCDGDIAGYLASASHGRTQLYPAATVQPRT